MQRSVSEITKLNEQKANLRSQNTQLTQDISQGKREHKTLLDTVARNVRKKQNTGGVAKDSCSVHYRYRVPISPESQLSRVLSCSFSCSRLFFQERALPGLRASLASSETQLTSLESELASAFSSGLDAGEEAELKALTLEVDGLKTELVKLRTKKADVEARKAELDSLLFNNLLRKEEELNGKLNAATQEDERETLQRDETELGALNAIIKDVESQLKKADAEIEQATTRIRTLDKELDTLRVSGQSEHTRTAMQFFMRASRSDVCWLSDSPFTSFFRRVRLCVCSISPLRVLLLPICPTTPRAWTSFFLSAVCT